jgi:hypothetical protein
MGVTYMQYLTTSKIIKMRYFFIQILIIIQFSCVNKNHTEKDIYRCNKIKEIFKKEYNKLDKKNGYEPFTFTIDDEGKVYSFQIHTSIQFPNELYDSENLKEIILVGGGEYLPDFLNFKAKEIKKIKIIGLSNTKKNKIIIEGNAFKNLDYLYAESCDTLVIKKDTKIKELVVIYSPYLYFENKDMSSIKIACINCCFYDFNFELFTKLKYLNFFTRQECDSLYNYNKFNKVFTKNNNIKELYYNNKVIKK